jgi:hypothetical protein
MSAQEPSGLHSPVLEAAWRRFAELDANSSKLSNRFLNLRRWVAVLGVTATLIAILIEVSGETWPPALVLGLKIILVAVPLSASGIAAFTTRRLGDGRWLAMRAGAEEILKEIFYYRSVMVGYPKRHRWLSNRLAAIQRQVYKNSNNRLDTDPYTGQIPPYYHPDDPHSDPGFQDIDGDEYLRYRVENQLNWHSRKLVQIRKQSRRLTIFILLMGAMGALLAGVGTLFNGLTVWVALTAAITTALTGWEELRSMDTTITNYSKVKLELNIVRDHWLSLLDDERTPSEFVRMIRSTENLLWAQNAEYIRSMQEALASVLDEEADAVEEMVRMSEVATKEMRDKMLAESTAVFDHTTDTIHAVVEDASDTAKGMVDTVGAEAMAITDTAEATVDTAVGEAAATREAFEETVEHVADETAALREDVQETVMEEVGATRETIEESVDRVAEETEAIRETASSTVDTAMDEVTETRVAFEETVDVVAEEAAVMRETVQETITEEVVATRELVDESAESLAGEAEALRETVEDSVETISDEAEEVRETIDGTTDTMVSKSAELREAVDTATEAAAANVDETVAIVANESVPPPDNGQTTTDAEEDDMDEATAALMAEAEEFIRLANDSEAGEETSEEGVG